MKKIMFNSKYGLDKAVLEGRKTMTRRISPNRVEVRESGYNACGFCDENDRDVKPVYKVGEVIAIAQSYEKVYYENILNTQCPTITVDEFNSPGWTNKMFVRAVLMPYAIKITEVKVERLQDITSEDCLKEGIFKHISHAKVYYMHEGIGNYFFETPRHAFASLIDRVFGKGTWDSNPWVFAYSFKVINNQIC